jgi:hypothetical protein
MYEHFDKFFKSTKEEYRKFYYNDPMYHSMMMILNELEYLKPYQVQSLIDTLKEYKKYHDEMMME